MRKDDPIKGKQLATSASPTTQGITPDKQFLEQLKERATAQSEPYFARKAENRRVSGMAKFAAGSAAIAAGMYYGLTKTIGGNVHYDAQGKDTGSRSKKRRVPIWSKDEGW
jgi:hypothetical protein